MRLIFPIWLASIASAVDFTEPDMMAGRRKQVEGFSLGPAPFPLFKDMDFELFGDAFIRGDSVKVTDDKQGQKGAIWSKSKYDLGASRDMQIDLKFRVGGKKDTLFGDGFALWYVSKRYRGVGGEALGGPDKWEGLGVFFDTFKNDELRSKKHPYVYAYINDGNKKYIDIKPKDIEKSGCHIPFRNKDSEDLEAVVARLTYRRQTLSLLMQPYAADDWVQCFSIENVELPEGGFLGVTAMTGEVTDKHQMISVELFNKLTMDPYPRGVENDKNQMPHMWEEMRHSGDVAREFESWEKQIEEEVDFSLKEHYVDDYYYNYYKGDGYYTDDESEDDYNDIELKINEDENILDKFEDPSYRNNYQKKVPKKKHILAVKHDGLTAAEIEAIDKMLMGTSIPKEIQTLNKDRRKRIHELQQHMESQFEARTKDITDLVRSTRRKEFLLSNRISKLAKKLNVQVDRLYEEEQKYNGTWVLPFAFLVVLLFAATGLSYAKFQKDMKSHLL